LERELHRVGEARLEALFQHEAIDDDVEIVELGAVELDLVAQIHHAPVDARANEALSAQAVELELELALACAAYGRQNRNARALWKGEDAVDDLLNGLRFDAFAAVRAMGNPNACKEETKVIGDLGYRSHRGARRLRERALLDGDCGG